MLATPLQLGQLALSALLGALAVGLGVRRRGTMALTQHGYRAQLRDPVRLGLFAIALAAFVVVAPYTGDPTWDAVDAAFMSVGCYVTAPWALATMFRVVARRARALELGLALIAWWIVCSASYDGYLLARDGVFPPTSVENAIASSVLYALGGLFFSIGVDARGGLTFVFTDARWPAWHGEPWTLRAAARSSMLAIAIATPIVVFLVWVVMEQMGWL